MIQSEQFLKMHFRGNALQTKLYADASVMCVYVINQLCNTV